MSSLTNTFGGNTLSHSYTYDANGNILSDGSTTYAYDSLNQLVWEYNTAAGKAWNYTYDLGGNILSKTEYDYADGQTTNPVTVSYTYGDAVWRDLLTAYNGEAITYDGIGNPTNYRGWGMSWQGGRQLASMQKDGTTLSFSYNDAGLRTEKTVNGSTRRYIWNSSQLMADVGANDAFYFHYSSGGELIGYTYKTADAETECILVKNQQGDVEKVIATDGTVLASYTYDAWGNVLTSEGSLAAANPIRYRGYYFDTETSLYYVSSRYYDPEVGRWTNTDRELAGVDGSVKGYNLFAYCHNNPANMADPEGNWPKWLTGALNVVSGTLQMAAGAALGAAAGWTGVGAVAAGFLVVNGAATMTQGIGQIVNNATQSRVLREDNIVKTGVQLAGRSIGGKTGEEIAGVVYEAAVIAANIYAAQTVNASGQCFVSGTPVLTVLGYKAIEEIREGDLVWSEDPETGKRALKTVVQTFVRESNELVNIYVNGESIVATPEHPFYVLSQGWTSAIELRTGDVLSSQNGEKEYATVDKIRYEILDNPVKVYNFEVDGFHTYYVGNNSILVHNSCRFNADQQAVLDLAKEYRSGISGSEAQTLWAWAQEYGISGHGPMSGHGTMWQGWHIKIKNIHIPIFPE